jgi:DNA-binding protein HU-beta
MTQAEFVALVAEKGGWSKSEAKYAIKTITDAIKESLKKEEKIPLKDFGKFSIKETKARTGRNPRTGEPMKIPAAKKVKFSAAKALKDSLGKPKKKKR